MANIVHAGIQPKVLVVYPSHWFSVCDIAINIYEAFERLGCCEVQRYPLCELYKAYKLPTGTNGTDLGWKLALTEALREMCDRERFDVVLVVHGANIPEQRLREMQECSGTVVLWLLDEPYEVDATRQYSRWYDRVFVNDRSVLDKHRNSHWLPAAANRRLHKRLDVVPERYRSDIFASGSLNNLTFKKRLRTLMSVYNRMTQHDTVIQGITPSLWSILQYERLPFYYNGARIVINIHRDRGWGTKARDTNRENLEPTTPNPRTFELAACRTFFITDNGRADIEQLFPGAVTFHDEDDLIEKLKHYIEEPEEREKITSSLPVYYYEDRARTIMEVSGYDVSNGKRDTDDTGCNRYANQRVLERGQA